MDQKSLTQILEEGENQKQAFLVDVSDRWNTAVLISSLANADGGSVWIGVKPNGKIVGVYAEGIQKELAELVKNYFHSPFDLNTKIWKNKVHFVLEVIVAKSKDNPIFLTNDRKQTVMYERHLTKSIQASKIALKNLQFKSQEKVLSEELCKEEIEILEFIKNHDKLSLSQLYKQLDIEMSQIDLYVSQLVYRDLIEMDFKSEVTLYSYKG